MSVSPRVLDLTGGARRSTTVLVSPAYVDFLIEIQTYQEPATAHTLDAGRTWFDDIRTRLAPDVGEALERLGRIGWGALLAMAIAEAWPPTVPAFVERVAAIAPVRLWEIVAGAHAVPLAERVGSSAYERAARGDGEARSQIVRAVADLFGEDAAEDEVHVLDLSAEELHRLILTSLEGWYRDVFAEHEAATTAVLDRDAQAKRHLAKTGSDEALIFAATNGLEWSAEPWVRRVALAPHLAMRPWNVMCAHDDLYVICYPVADESLGVDRSAPPARLVRLHKALADERRLRILRLLADEGLTLQRIADAVGLAKSSAHHHMVILRSAGLVSTRISGDSRYALRPETLQEAPGLLQRYLEGGAT